MLFQQYFIYQKYWEMWLILFPYYSCVKLYFTSFNYITGNKSFIHLFIYATFTLITMFHKYSLGNGIDE